MQLRKDSEREVWVSSLTMLFQAENFELDNVELRITGMIHKKG